MKKTLIALAAVAATSASFAQSSVTLSGQVETGLEKRFSGDATRMTSNRNGTSNWTLSGTEDLGGGLKAVFRVSTAFNADDGTSTAVSNGITGTALGNNGMFVGAEGGFGRLIVGRPVHLLWGNVLAANGTKGVSLHDSASLLGANGKNANARSGVYVDNAIQYFSPRFGGVQVQLEYAPSEVVGNKAGAGIAVRYDAGPLAVSFTNYKGAGTNAVTAVPGVVAAQPGNASPKAVSQIAAAYDFGLARVLLTYRDQGGRASNIDNSYALGVTAPVGPGSAYLSYNVNEQAADDAKTVIAGYKYNLSKRTLAFVNVAQRNTAYAGATITGAGGNGAKSSTGYGFGLQHSF